MDVWTETKMTKKISMLDFGKNFDEDLQKVAVLLAGFPNGEKLADMIGFALFDNDVVANGNNSYAYPEAQEA